MADGMGCKCYARSAGECGCVDVDWTPQEVIDLQTEVKHWKANHAAEVKRSRMLKERPDLPIERIQAYEKWQDDMRDAERYRWLRTNALDCQDTNGLEIVRLIPAHRSPNHADIDAAIDAAMTPND